MARYKFELTGQMPLLMHADDVQAADELMEWRKAPENKNVSKSGDDRSPAWTWMTYLYADGERVAMPADNIMVSLRQAGANLILKGQKTFKALSQSGLIISSVHCDFMADDKPVELTEIQKIRELPFAKQAEAVRDLGFSLFVKRAKIGQSKHVRVRPKFDHWTVSGTIDVVADEITPEILTQMFEIAGDRYGLCDWRPGCKTPGPFGRFSAKIKAA